MRRFVPLLLLLIVLPASAFDQGHITLNALLRQHVRVIDGGVASRVDYAGIKRDRAALDAYTQSLSALPETTFNRWARADQMAFLINAYNAFTLELILTRYPGLKSIKDLGGLFSSPWKQDFFTLLGTKTHLDHIEQNLLRAPGRYDDPRIHFALTCASLGCPMLRDEAYVGARLDAQLDDAMRRFLTDRSRNRYDPAADKLLVSKIFDWYGQDFDQGHHGFTSVAQTLAQFADQLADSPGARARIRTGQVPIDFRPYDWGLNDVGH